MSSKLTSTALTAQACLTIVGEPSSTVREHDYQYNSFPVNLYSHDLGSIGRSI